MLNKEEHRKLVQVTSLLAGIPSEALDHVGDASWSSFGVVAVHASGCPVLNLFQAVEIRSIDEDPKTVEAYSRTGRTKVV